MFTRAGKMTFLSGQDDFFRTANQPISVRHLSQPYNNPLVYFLLYNENSKTGNVSSSQICVLASVNCFFHFRLQHNSILCLQIANMKFEMFQQPQIDKYITREG